MTTIRDLIRDFAYDISENLDNECREQIEAIEGQEIEGEHGVQKVVTKKYTKEEIKDGLIDEKLDLLMERIRQYYE